MKNIRCEYAYMLNDILLNRVSLSALKNDEKRKDIAFMNMLLMTTLRKLTFIKTVILPRFVRKKIPQKQHLLEIFLWLGITELLFMNSADYAVVNSYVNAAKNETDKFGANFVNAVLRNVLRSKDELLKLTIHDYFSKNFLDILKKDYTLQEIKDMEEFASFEPPLDITIKSPFEGNNINGILLPTGSIRLDAHTKVTDVYGFNDGLWWVQDAASALPVLTLKPYNLKGKKVLDFCAAPGGKTAQLLNESANVLAIDISEKRLETLKTNMERLKLTDNLNIITADARCYLAKEQYDFVLVDAPCSATGTFRRHPEIMHTKTLDDVKKMVILQKEILENAANFVKKGGILTYATCSLSKDEGEKQILNFLDKHKNFTCLPINLKGTENMRTTEGFLRVLPQHFKAFLGIDGFFVANLQRKI